MQKALFIKLFIISTLCVIFLIVLAMIDSLVNERQSNARQVINELEQQHVGKQQVITPFLLLTRTTEKCQEEQIKQKDTSNKKTTTVCSESSQLSSILPAETQSNQKLEVSDDNYKRGIYSTTSYTGNLAFTQQYNISQLSVTDVSATSTSNADILKADITNNTNANNKKLDEKKLTTYQKSGKTKADADNKQQTNHQLDLLIPISDLRGVTKMPVVTIDGQTYQAKYPVPKTLTDLEYLQVSLPNELLSKLLLSKKSPKQSLQIDISVPISGMSEIQNIPLGEVFSLSTEANWHAPNFVGQALPYKKQLNAHDFTASWQNRYLAVQNNQLLMSCISESQNECKLNSNNFMLNSFDVQFAKPNDVYRQTERSLKYALLIIAISFGSFFLFEVIKSLRIHPAQYLLVSMALLVFYVLLLSLAEQVAFWKAYAIAATACAGLIGWYAYFVLQSVSRATLFTTILAGQYIGFYTILTIEDLNLLIGAILCFGIVASVMFLTRNINWYEIR